MKSDSSILTAARDGGRKKRLRAEQIKWGLIEQWNLFIPLQRSNSSDRATWLNVNDSEYDYSLFMDSDGRLNGGYQCWMHQKAQGEQSVIVKKHVCVFVATYLSPFIIVEDCFDYYRILCMYVGLGLYLLCSLHIRVHQGRATSPHEYRSYRSQRPFFVRTGPWRLRGKARLPPSTYWNLLAVDK